MSFWVQKAQLQRKNDVPKMLSLGAPDLSVDKIWGNHGFIRPPRLFIICVFHPQTSFHLAIGLTEKS